VFSWTWNSWFLKKRDVFTGWWREYVSPGQGEAEIIIVFPSGRWFFLARSTNNTMLMVTIHCIFWCYNFIICTALSSLTSGICMGKEWTQGPTKPPRSKGGAAASRGVLARGRQMEEGDLILWHPARAVSARYYSEMFHPFMQTQWPIIYHGQWIM